MPIELVLPEDQRQKLAERLTSGQLRRANYQIVKRTTVQLVKLVRKEIRQQTTINKKYVDRVITTVNPQGDPPVGKVIIKKKAIPLAAFKARVLKRGGVSVRVSKLLPPVVLRHAFMAEVGEGEHAGIFLRARHLPSKGPNAGKVNKHGHPALKLTAQGFAGRLAIKEQLGPSIHKLVSVPDVLRRIRFDAAAYMAKQAQSQLDRFTKGQPVDTSPEISGEP